MIFKSYITLLYVFFLFLPPYGLNAQEVKGKATYFSDGDTFRFISNDSIKLKVRVADIDCPEKTQAYGLEAKEFVMKQIQEKEITLQVIKTDRYGRKVSRVLYDGKDLSEELIRNGLAWHFSKYSKDLKLTLLEQQAKLNKVGLWSSKNQIPPWDFRKKRKKALKTK